MCNVYLVKDREQSQHTKCLEISLDLVYHVAWRRVDNESQWDPGKI